MLHRNIFQMSARIGRLIDSNIPNSILDIGTVSLFHRARLQSFCLLLFFRNIVDHVCMCVMSMSRQSESESVALQCSMSNLCDKRVSVPLCLGFIHGERAVFELKIMQTAKSEIFRYKNKNICFDLLSKFDGRFVSANRFSVNCEPFVMHC